MERSESLKFEFAHQFDRTCEQPLSSVHASLLTEADAFRQNVERVLQIAALPANIVHWMMIMGHAQVLACAALSLPLTTDINKLQEPIATKLHEEI